MAGLLELPLNILGELLEVVRNTPGHILLLVLVGLVGLALGCIYIFLLLVAPVPRPPYPSEKSYTTTTPSGATETKSLTCWYDSWVAHREASVSKTSPPRENDVSTGFIEPASIEMSLVVPAYNEEERLTGMLEEAVSVLDNTYGRISRGKGTGTGYEILLVNDGSKDKTVQIALDFSRKNNLHDVLRIVTLEENRGKGGAVTHGMRHVRGEYAVFADADGASRFTDLGKLVAGAKKVMDSEGRAVAVGSRAWLVGSDAVVKRSALRNALMHSFHLLLRLLTPPATSRIRDTQCGFKLFTRAALPHIIPYMHAEGWIFDVEMLMLAESAPGVGVGDENGKVEGGIKVSEQAIGWQEVGGSKLNVMWDSLGMAWGLAVLRGAWGMGVWRRR
ncbi:6fff2b23-dc70-4308-b765-b575f43b6525 [Sclerotinia trifoliorum]|uniref:dolichyl-phosphate beta-glucosyltransferase n=1 Tax=Sclerotinia trifoliorum TaxID=28548 RepID=A0A8H2ZSS2_9HELO|nr:6fff2b23-dc70-4308-b765-b575f43b6525 [Sclerotinia trifoliorum]